ncbi:MAG: lasso peptide biosynthesis protein [Porphyrobacter sp.]|nr:lasso peptide biosynthesis protein [Porphyrobacter sp.]
MTSGISRWLIAAAAFGPAAAFASAALPAPATDLLFAIRTPAGETIGWQHEQDGTTERQLAMRVHGHDVQSEYQHLTRSPDGKVVLRQGTSERNARKVRADSIDAITPFSTVIAAARGTSQSGLRRLGTLPGGEILVERRIAGQFDAAWLVTLTPQGTAARIRVPVLGGDWLLEPVAARPAAVPGNLVHPMVDAPYDIPRSAQAGHIRYFIAIPSGAGLPLPETGEQRIAPLGADRWQIDLCTDCGPGLPSDPAFLAEARRPARWLEANAPELTLAARKATGPRRSEAAVMRALARTARSRLRDIDYNGHASALAAWKQRRGDCTEDAVLLTALARAAGIPAKVASGLAYERSAYHGTASAFFPHAWTVAYVDGAWRSFDISSGGFSSAHIALSISDGEPARITAAWRLAALIAWQDMAEVRPRTRP